MEYEEFKLSVPICDLSDETSDDDSQNVTTLFELLSITRAATSLANRYDSYYDHNAAKYFGDPCGRTGLGDLLIFLSDSDDETFIAIDMFREATDQMDMVGIGVRAQTVHAPQVFDIMRSIRLNAEVASALLQGNLGLKETVAFDKFPRSVQNHDSTALQHIQIYKNGKLLQCSRSPKPQA